MADENNIPPLNNDNKLDLNGFLQPNVSPITAYQTGYTSAYDFANDTERNAVNVALSKGAGYARLSSSSGGTTAGYNQVITSGTANVALTSGTLDISTTGSANIFAIIDASSFIGFGGTAAAMRINLMIDINGVIVDNRMYQVSGINIGGGTVITDNADFFNLVCYTIAPIRSGTNTLIARMRLDQVSGGTPSMTVYSYNMNYIIMS